jgi:hypothetical protein
MQAQHGRSEQAALTAGLAGSHDGDMQAQSLKLDSNAPTKNHIKKEEKTPRCKAAIVLLI